MPFNTLTAELQNLLLVNHSYITKWIVFLFIIFFSAFYIWGIWPNNKPTVFMTQAFMRVFFYALSVGFLASSPLMLMAMSPELSFLDWYILPLKIYSVITSLVFVFIFIDLIKLGIFYILAQAGLNIDHEKINRLLLSWQNFKEFMKPNRGNK